MADLFNTDNSTDDTRFEEFCDVYLLYFDESMGHVPLFIYPHEDLKDNKKYMRPIKYHSIWFLDIEEESALDHVDVEYKGFTFFGKKFYAESQREKRRAGLDEETPETIVLIVSLPNDIDIFGDELIKRLTKVIQDNFGSQLVDIIECEIAKEEVIKTPKVKKCIQKGKEIKKELKKAVKKTINEFFSKTLRKKADTDSIKKQKAISFLSLKGIEINHISKDEGAPSFSDISLFGQDKEEKKGKDLFKRPLKITDVNIFEDSQEIEIMVQNTTDNELHDVKVKITHVKEFFEKEIMNQIIDLWFPQEELLFISPIIPHINEYLFFIVEEENKQQLLSKKIDLELLKNKKA
ncbi:MAG: hypothetical protein ACOC4M_10540 [Promethearchaeia archaeon]